MQDVISVLLVRVGDTDAVQLSLLTSKPAAPSLLRIFCAWEWMALLWFYARL